jgi:hypothetical protein
MNAAKDEFSQLVQAAADSFQYPGTPDIALTVRDRISTRPISRGIKPRSYALATMMLLLVICAALLAVPSVRAAVLEFFQAGSIRIFPRENTATLVPVTTPAITRTLPPTPTPADLIALEDLFGNTTLADVTTQATFTLKLPEYPPDLGEPDLVFLQDMDGAMVIMVWTSPDHPDQAELVLYQIAPGSWVGEKWGPITVEETQVSGLPALWAEGPYPMRLSFNRIEHRRLITGHALVWERDGITYRIESNLSQAEAIKIAESLKAAP